MHWYEHAFLCCLMLDFILKSWNTCYDLRLIAMPIFCLIFVAALFLLLPCLGRYVMP